MGSRRENIITQFSAEGQTGSHTHLWKDFTENLLTKLSNDYPHIVFILLGNDARQKSVFIKKQSIHHRLVHIVVFLALKYFQSVIN